MLRRYVVDRPAVIVSIVPEGELDLAATGRTPEQRAMEVALDRTQQPPPGAPRPFHTPDVWRSQLANGVTVAGTHYDELPLTTISLYVPAGRLQEDLAHLGLASLTADLLDEGTQRMTAPELEDAFDALGAGFSVRSGDDEIAFSLSALDAKLEESVALFTEAVLSPRMAPEDFERIKTERLTDIEVRADNIRAIAGDVWDALMFGPGTIEGSPSIGTAETVGALTLDDVRRFWARHGTPHGSRLVYVGDRDAEGVAALAEADIVADGQIRVGEPAHQIARYAEEMGADLVIVGHQRRGVLSRWWQGSVGAALLDRLDCSLLIAQDIAAD